MRYGEIIITDQGVSEGELLAFGTNGKIIFKISYDSIVF